MARTIPRDHTERRDRSAKTRDGVRPAAATLVPPPALPPSADTSAYAGSAPTPGVPQFTLESAYGSVPALDPARDLESAIRVAKAEKASRTVHDLS